MLQRMSVKLVLLTAVTALVMGAADNAAAVDPMTAPTVVTEITKFNTYRTTTYIPGMVTARAYMPAMKISKPLLPAMRAKMQPVVMPVMIQNVQSNIIQPPPFVPGPPPLWP